MSKLALLKKIETVKRRINKERDALRELITNRAPSSRCSIRR